MEQKSWWYYHTRVNSEWFRNMREPDRGAVLAALEVMTHRSTARLRGGFTVIFFALIYGLAGGLWGLALNFSPRWFMSGGAGVGILLGGIAAAVITSKPTPDQSKDMQFAANSTFGMLGILIGLVGLVVWGLRALFFR
jgi:hypothetical protein